MANNLEFVYPAMSVKWTEHTMSFYDSVWYQMMLNNVAFLYYKQNPANFVCPYTVELYDTVIYGDVGSVPCLGVTYCSKNLIQLQTVPFYTGIVVGGIANTFAHELAHWIAANRCPTSSTFMENAVHFAYNDALNLYGYRYTYTLSKFLQCPTLNISLVDIDKVLRDKDRIECLIRSGQAPQGKNPYWTVA